jgi:hypothetical protein
MQAWVDPVDLWVLPRHIAEGPIESFHGQAETKGETNIDGYDPRQRSILFLWDGTSSGMEEGKGRGPSVSEMRYQQLLEPRS